MFSGRPGSTHLASHFIATGEAKPVSHQPQIILQVWQETVRGEVNDMIAAGVIEPSSSLWTSPVVPVRKKDGTLRLCIDHRQLNYVMQDDKYQMPRVEEMVEQLGKAKYISSWICPRSIIRFKWNRTISLPHTNGKISVQADAVWVEGHPMNLPADDGHPLGSLPPICRSVH